MATHEVKDVEKALKNIPKHLLSAKLKTFILNRVNKADNNNDKRNATNRNEKVISNVDSVSIPSLGDFDELLEEVSSSIEKIVYLNDFIGWSRLVPLGRTVLLLI